MKKRVLSFLTLLCMITALLPTNITVFPATSGYYTYTVSNGEATITACDTSISGNITIPSTLGNYPVTKIGYDVFHNCQNITGIVIPDTIISIGVSSIWGCENLKTLTIGKNLKGIGSNVFCSLYALETIKWNAENLTYLIGTYDDNYVFDGAGKNSNGVTIIFGDNVKSIPAWAFNPDDEYPNISKIVMGKNIQKIGKRAFIGYSQSEALYSVYIDSLENYLSIEFADEQSYPTIAAKELYVNNVLLTKLNIPEGVEHLSKGLISQNKTITQITIPSSVTSIDNSAFCYCTQLKEINVASNNACYSSVSGVLFNKDKTELISMTDKSKLTNYAVPDKVTTIKKYAFSSCDNLISITIPTSVTKVEEYAFVKCKNLKTIYFNGTKEDFMIDVSTGYTNSPYFNAQKVYLKCKIILSDNNGNEISNKIQNYGEYIDTSSVIVPIGYALKLYKDQALTKEYSLDAPICENLNLYYDIIEVNKLKITGAGSADIGQKGITESVTFATDKTAKDFVATIKYSDKLNLSTITEKDFSITENLSETKNGYTYLYLTCTYKNDENMPKNTTLNAFDLVFDVSESATANEKLTIEFVGDDTFLADSGNSTYDFDGLGTAEIKINPIFVKSVTINGADEIDKATQYIAVISPENATNKDIEWTVDNSEIATISADGILTPVKAGTVKVTATAKDGSGIYGEKSVNVKVYATITSLSANVGVWNKTFTPTEREYIIYVPKNTSSIKLTPTHNGTLLKGTTKCYSGRNTIITLTDKETVLTLTYSQTGYTDSEYKIKIVKFEGTKTTVSEDGTTFTIKPINIASGNTVILTLYNGEKFVAMQSAVYSGTNIPFAITNDYTTAKVMVWNNSDDIMPICDVEIVNTESNR